MRAVDQLREAVSEATVTEDVARDLDRGITATRQQMDMPRDVLGSQLDVGIIRLQMLARKLGAKKSLASLTAAGDKVKKAVDLLDEAQIDMRKALTSIPSS